MSFLWIFFGVNPFLNYFFGVIYNSKQFFGVLHISWMAYTYVLQGLKIQFCLRPCLMTGLGEILEAGDVF